MGRVTWLAHAADAGQDGNRKLDQAWRVGMEAEGSGETGVTCHWTARPCLWHWAATMSCIWR
jgi:hypothetical protein